MCAVNFRGALFWALVLCVIGVRASGVYRSNSFVSLSFLAALVHKPAVASVASARAGVSVNNGANWERTRKGPFEACGVP